MDRVADYALLRKLGDGERSEVYLARTPARLGLEADTVAVKVLPLPFVDGFEELAATLGLFAALGCPQLVPMYDLGIDAGTVYYAMRHEPSGSLAAPGRQLSRRERLGAVAAAARGAHAMHDAGLAHRGIGPTNVLLGADGPVLAEPAVGHILTQGHTLIGLGTTSRTGRLEFLAPELMRGQPAGRASDIWSLGVTLHLLLTGHGLFPALASADPFTAVRIYLRSRPEPGEDLTDGERAVIVTTLHPDPAHRYPTAADLADAVDELARRAGAAPERREESHPRGRIG